MTSAAPGVVTSVVDLGSRSYGRYVVVDHGNGWSTLYAHLLSQWVTQGQSVDQGQVIGQLGSTGGSTGPHLHFEERMNRRDLPTYYHRLAFTMGSTLSSLSCNDTVLQGGDWNGDGTEEPALFRRAKVAKFILRRTGTTPLRIPFGLGTDQPVSGDWNGDGASDVGVRRPGWKAFLLRNADGTSSQITLGKVSDVGVTGDWDGNGATEVGVWSPATRVFTLRNANGTVRTVALGSLGRPAGHGRLERRPDHRPRHLEPVDGHVHDARPDRRPASSPPPPRCWARRRTSRSPATGTATGPATWACGRRAPRPTSSGRRRPSGRPPPSPRPGWVCAATRLSCGPSPLIGLVVAPAPSDTPCGRAAIGHFRARALPQPPNRSVRPSAQTTRPVRPRRPRSQVRASASWA